MPDPGRLLVCATPIGHLGDITVRVLEALRTADVVLAEDTRVTRKLFAHYDIDTRLERYDDHVADRVTPKVLARMEAGTTFALVSDAGTPGVSDPGERLVAACIDAGLAVEVLPGASAIMTALVASGLPTGEFHFAGFLPRKPGPARRRLAELAALEATLVFYESPHRAAETLALVTEALPGRRAALARELTKLHEEILRGDVSEVATEIGRRETLKGEIVLLVGPPPKSDVIDVDDDVLAAMVAELMEDGMSRSDAARAVAAETGASRNRAYQASLGEADS